MAYIHKAFTVTMVTGASVTSAFETMGWSNISIEAPSFSASLPATTANVRVQVCDTPTGTFRDLRDMGSYSATSGVQVWEIPSSTGDFIASCRPLIGYAYAKIALLTAATNTLNFRVHTHQQTY